MLDRLIHWSLQNRLFVLVGAAIVLFPGGTGQPVEVKLPASFSAAALSGRTLFEKNCQSCHFIRHGHPSEWNIR